jgi:hypothetical protein
LKHTPISMKLLYLLFFLSFACLSSNAQRFEALPLDDLSGFVPTGKNWKIAGKAIADFTKEKQLQSEKGKGVLINLPSDKHYSNLQTQLQHGDIDLELEFMMAKKSNSGIYLQGKYELQLLDSWGVKYPAFGDCGGIYERWDDTQAEGQKGYQGHAPRINACRAPGLWQKLFISFQAPRFDAYGNKIANARFLKVELNGVLIQENVELTGPTRGGGEEEVEKGPIFFQGDHGPVAFRNIRYRTFGSAPPILNKLTYEHYQVTKDDLILDGLKPKASGATERLSHEVMDENEKFTLRFRGQLSLAKSGRYYFDINSFGWSSFKIGDHQLFPRGPWLRRDSIDLKAGVYDIELRYSKMGNWFSNGLGLFVEGPGLRPYALHAESSLPPSVQSADPIFVDFALEPVILRSFVDFQGLGDSVSHRVTHAVSVGFSERLAYNYNLKSGALFQLWRSAFLDATPMWHDRGDGSGKPIGDILKLEDVPTVARLSSANAPWPEKVTEEMGYRGRGYALESDGRPTFRYDALNLSLEDAIQANEKGKQLNRTLTWQGTAQTDDYILLARGNDIEALSAGLYLIGKRYYIQVPGKSAVKPQIRTSNGLQELLIPMSGLQTYSYQIIW